MAETKKNKTNSKNKGDLIDKTEHRQFHECLLNVLMIE